MKVQRESVVSCADLKLEEITEFFKVFNANACGGESITRGALLLLWMTGLRVDAVVGMEWSEVDLDQGLWLMPSSRLKTWTPGEDAHQVHLTDHMSDLLERLGKVSAVGVYVFPGRMRAGVTKHINDSPNQHLKNL